MSAHTCQTIDPACYRCDLNLDEMRSIADECVVTINGVVHYDDCSYVSGVCSTAQPWVGTDRLSTDRPCSRCMPAGLPIEVPA